MASKKAMKEVQKAGHLKEEYQWIEKAITVPLSGMKP